MPPEQILQYLLSGITNGSIYAIAAIGFNIVYNTTGIINFAQGEFLMLGAMIAITFSKIMPLWLAIPLSIIITAGVGALVDIVFIRRMKKPTVLNMIIVTIGISILLKEAALHIWDEKVRSLRFFSGDETSSVNIGGAFISPQVFWVLGVCALIVSLLTLFFRYTALGRSMRATASDPDAARLCGISTKNMITLSFMLAAAIGAAAGAVVSPLTQTQYDCGTSFAVKGFTVAIIGGLGNSIGAVIGGILIGVLEAFSISFLPLAFKDVISIGILLILLFVKPSGLFGNKAASSLRKF
ncbi:MAG: branched-chain amino acid ABC transporter permease [Spirochaetota bacterium]